MPFFLKRLLVQISMLSSRSILVKVECICNLKLKESLAVSLLVVNDAKITTKYFTSLYIGVCKVDKIGLKGGQLSTHFCCTLQESYIIPGLFPTGFKCLPLSSDMLIEQQAFYKCNQYVFLDY